MLWTLSLLPLALSAPAPGEIPHPDQQVQAALAFQALLREADRPYIVFLRFEDVPQKQLWDYRRYLGFWCNQLSFERSLRVPQTVPGSAGRLAWLDLRWYGWNRRAWRSVAEREPFTREPWLTHRTAEALRQGAGYRVQPVKGDDGRETTPLVVLVSGRWFLRETLESDRSPSYYDLLFARFRFPDGDYQPVVNRKVRKTRQVYHPGGDYTGHPDGRVRKQLAPGTYTLDYEEEVTEDVRASATATSCDVDFPKDIKDWERAFGIDKLRLFARETQIDLDFGAVVAGGRDDPERGSIVALNNRLLVLYRGPLGKHMRSYDVFKTHADRDYSEKLIFKNGTFRKGDGADAVFDAGEILSDLPNGGQAGFLIDGKGNRAEIAANKAASAQHADGRLNAGVRNYGDCIICHAGGGGFVLPRDQEKEDQRLGIKRKFKDKEQESRYRGFFEAWEEDIAAESQRYHRLVARTTVHPDRMPILDREAGPWTGSKVAQMTGSLRDRYDEMVTPERAARELGVPVKMLQYLASRGGVSPDYKVRNHRLQQLVQGKSIPSATWESDVFRQVGFLLDAYRSDPEYKRLSGSP